MYAHAAPAAVPQDQSARGVTAEESVKGAVDAVATAKKFENAVSECEGLAGAGGVGRHKGVAQPDQSCPPTTEDRDS